MNFLLLLCISLVPLVTSFLGEHPQLARAIAFYALVMTLSCAAFGQLRYLSADCHTTIWHIQFRSDPLVRSFTATVLYAVAGIAARYAPALALALLVLAPAMFNMPMLLSAFGTIEEIGAA